MADEWEDIETLLRHTGPYAHSDFESSQDLRPFLSENCKVLVLGAGGLGCELLKNLCLMGFSHVDVIDLDTVELSNLNRQFLFRECNVGESKAIVAARFINGQIPSANVTPHHARIEDMPNEFYAQFHLIIAGLDSIEARRYINAIIHQPDIMVPLIDGGTEGWKGHVRVVIPKQTACFECALDTFPAQKTTYPLCTLAETPRLPEHCIQWAYILEWPRVCKGICDLDDADDLLWLFTQASQRASTFGIPGVTPALVQGVLKNIVPAIASTNAIVSAACVNEAFKLATQCAIHLDNYMMYNGSKSAYQHTFSMDRLENCPICNASVIDMVLSQNEYDTFTLSNFIDYISTLYKLQSPSLRTATRTLAIHGTLAYTTAQNLTLPLGDLVQVESDIIYVTATSLPKDTTLRLRITFDKQ